jgi:hypothetical protein
MSFLLLPLLFPLLAVSGSGCQASVEERSHLRRRLIDVYGFVAVGHLEAHEY